MDKEHQVTDRLLASMLELLKTVLQMIKMIKSLAVGIIHVIACYHRLWV
jgi:hypothetical protein